MKFAYELLNSEGAIERGSLEAVNENEARRQLQRHGATLLGVTAQASTSGRGKVSSGDLLLAFTELSTLLHSGVGIAESVTSIASSHDKDAMREILERLGRAISQGKPFAEALRGCGARLPDYFYQLATAGEMTGKLAASLDEAIEQLSYQQDVNSEIRNALIYPTVLVGTGVLAVAVMFSFVVPKFSGLLRDADSLPWLAWAVLSAGKFMNENLLLVLFLSAAALTALLYPLRYASVRETIYDNMARWPVIGPWLTEAETARWAAMLGALLAQGVPMLDSLALANQGLRIATRRRRLDAAARAVKGGLALSKALEDQGAFSATAYNLLRTGERAGKLPEMLKSLAKLYGKSGRTRMKRVLLLVEPLAILLIGSAIGVIVIGIILAITSMSDIPL